MESYIIYVDISQYLTKRLNTGIQRVIKEFILRAMNDIFTLHVIYFNKKENEYFTIAFNELNLLFTNIKDYKIKEKIKINLFENTDIQKIFFEIDSVWNGDEERNKFYPKLKLHNYLIVNFIYDLIPVLYPNFMYQQTKQNFPVFFKAVYTYSDLILFDSTSSKQDFFKLLNISLKKKYIPSEVIYLGSNFTNNSYETSKYKDLLEKKYLLFVATIEPRKEQMLVLKAFEELNILYPDLHLIYVGRIGWNVDQFMKYLYSHKLKDKNIHHLDNIDDDELVHFYGNAFITLYLSQYEGYGLPIAEALFFNNIIITSNNSSLKEVGEEFALYIKNNTKQELVELIVKYLENEELYNQRKYFIKKNYKSVTWDGFYQNIIKTFSNKLDEEKPSYKE